jgi:hypothetical protein
METKVPPGTADAVMAQTGTERRRIYTFVNYFVNIKFYTAVFIWHDNGIILNPKFHLIFFVSVLNIKDTNTSTEDYWKFYTIHLFIT